MVIIKYYIGKYFVYDFNIVPNDFLFIFLQEWLFILCIVIVLIVGSLTFCCIKCQGKLAFRFVAIVINFSPRFGFYKDFLKVVGYIVKVGFCRIVCRIIFRMIFHFDWSPCHIEWLIYYLL